MWNSRERASGIAKIKNPDLRSGLLLRSGRSGKGKVAGVKGGEGGEAQLCVHPFVSHLLWLRPFQEDNGSNVE